MEDRIKTTVYLDRADYARIEQLARRQGQPAAALVREAIAQYVRQRPAGRLPSSLGAGRSGRGDLGERAEELLDGLGEEA